MLLSAKYIRASEVDTPLPHLPRNDVTQQFRYLIALPVTVLFDRRFMSQ